MQWQPHIQDILEILRDFICSGDLHMQQSLLSIYWASHLLLAGRLTIDRKKTTWYDKILDCECRYRELQSRTGDHSSGRWSAEENKKLQEAVEEYLALKQVRLLLCTVHLLFLFSSAEILTQS